MDDLGIYEANTNMHLTRRHKILLRDSHTKLRSHIKDIFRQSPQNSTQMMKLWQTTDGIFNDIDRGLKRLEMHQSRVKRHIHRLVEEKSDLSTQLHECLMRRHEDPSKELLEENKRLRDASTTPVMMCSVCMDHKAMGSFMCFNPCGHMHCVSVSRKSNSHVNCLVCRPFD